MYPLQHRTRLAIWEVPNNILEEKTMSLSRAEKRSLARMVVMFVIVILSGFAMIRGCDAVKSRLETKKAEIEHSLGLDGQ